MSKQAIELRFAAHYRILLKYFGQLCLIISVLTLLPLSVSLVSGKMHISLRYAAVILLLVGFGMIFGRLRVVRQIQLNEAIILVAFIFLFTPLVMSYPMMGSGLSFLDAFFEAISGCTTTGLSTLPTVEGKSAEFLFARSWMQWYGGLGIVVLSLALVVPPGLLAKGLAVTETKEEDLIGGTKAHARRVLVVYAILTGAGILLLMFLGADLFSAVVYAMAAVSTGGFSPHDGSLASLGTWQLQVAVILICLSGSIPLTFYHRVYRDGLRYTTEVLQLHGVLIIGLLVTLLFGMCMWRSSVGSWAQVFHHAPLMAFSAQTTAGFSSMELSNLDAASKLVLILSMAIGGGIGSTAGGFKILRLLITVRMIQLMILRTCLPRHAVLSPRLTGRRLEEDEIREAMLIILLFMTVILISWFAFLSMGYEPIDSLFEVVSATGTVGLSVGIIGPDLPALLKGIICADMLMGRLEIVAWLVMFYPGTWFGRRREAA